MSFQTDLAGYSAPQIVAALGCPRQTAYAWLDGSRQPPEWQQRLFLREIRRKTTKAQQNAAQNQPPAASRSGRKTIKGKR